MCKDKNIDKKNNIRVSSTCSAACASASSPTAPRPVKNFSKTQTASSPIATGSHAQSAGHIPTARTKKIKI